MIYAVVKKIVYVLFKIFFSLEIKGIGNIPPKDAFIIASNHASYFDPMAIAVSSKRKISFMAKQELFKNRVIGWFLNKLNAYPLRRDSADSRALRGTINRLRKKGGVLIFPEGTRAKDGDLREGKIGISVLSFLTSAVVVPCYIKGSFEIWPPHSRFFQKGKLAIFFGRPIKPPQDIRKDTKKDGYYRFAQEVMSHIRVLKEKAAHGY